MANTALLQAVVQTLLQGRPASPIAPVPAPIPSGGFTPPGGFGMPMLDAPPTVAPVAPAPALDQSLIEQLTGPRPVAPVTQPVSLLQKIALALQGFGAGVEGRGPQFLAQLDEQRQRPQREFQAATEQYESNRRRAVGIAEDKRQGERADIQRRADIQSGREFQLYEGELRDRRQEARDLRLQAAALEREERKVEGERLEQERKQKAQQERDARLIARDFGKVGAPPAVAKNLGDYYAGLTDKLSPEAAKFESAQARLADIRARKAATGGTGTSAGDTNAATLEMQFNALKARFLNAEKPTQGMPRGDRALMDRIAAQFPAVMNKLEKLGWEVGYDGIYPYIKPPQAQSGRQQAAPQAQNNDPGDVRRHLNAGRN